MSGRFTNEQREHFLSRVAFHYLAMPGKTQHEIGQVIGKEVSTWENQEGRGPLNQSTISRALATLRERWMKSALMSFDRRKSIELAKIDRLEWEYWDAWQRSREEATTRTRGDDQKVVGRGPDGTAILADVRKTGEKTEERYGDPRFLQGVQWCVQKRIEILGLEPPKRVQVEGGVGQPSTFAEWVKRATLERDRARGGNRSRLGPPV